MVEFVNPYTFVPLTPRPVRGRPDGHDRLRDGRLSGQLRVRLTARTPLLVGMIGQRKGQGESSGNVPDDELTDAERPGPVQDLPRRHDGTVVLPGSGLLGAVRSVHEALAGGCLRVVNGGFTPVHRHPVASDATRNLQLALVTQVDGAGAPAQVALATRTTWVNRHLLGADARGGLPHTGDRLTISDSQVITAKGRDVVSAGAVPRRDGLSTELDGSWALLLTDTKTRTEDRAAWFAAAQLTSDSRLCTVDAAAWEAYRSCVDGTDDFRVYRQGSGRTDPVWMSDAKPEFVEVSWPPRNRPGAKSQPIGWRLPARPFLFLGQPVWVRVAGQRVTEIRLSQFWRYPGTGPVGKRIGEAGPCSDAERLCPSCQVFGSVDPHGRDDDDVAAQRAYRGHMRIDEAYAVGDVTPMPWTLAPLSTPKPSAGQFYLDHGALARTAAGKDRPAAANWGSDFDRPGLRPVRGRKFYWRTTAPDQPTPPRVGAWPRGAARPDQSEKLTRKVRLIPADTKFETRVTFDNLTPAQVGGLLAALAPGELFADGGSDIVTSVGGGKPFGFGAASVDVEIDRLDSAASRYLGGSAPEYTNAELVACFKSTVPEQTQRDVWPALASALRLGAVPDDLVWYPPGTAGTQGEEKFDEGFEFWQKSAGATLSNEVRPLVELPRPHRGDQRLDSKVTVTRVVKSDRNAGQRGRGGDRGDGGGRAGRDGDAQRRGRRR